MPLPSGFREVVIALITAPMTVQEARTIAETVNPYFFEDFLYFFEKRHAFSLSSISVLSCESSNLRSATLVAAASFPEDKAFSSLITALSSSFWHSSSDSWPLRSSSGFVLMNLSSSVFLSFYSKAILRVSLSTFFVISLSVFISFVCHKALF